MPKFIPPPTPPAPLQPRRTAPGYPPPPIRWPASMAMQMQKIGPPAPPPTRFSAVGAAQRSAIQCMKEDDDDAAHNWDNVLAQYNGGVAAREVENAFLKAGYFDDLREKILLALHDSGYGNHKIAHGKGGKGSNVRGGTNEAIEACKNALITWANDHAKGGFGKKKKKKKGRRGGDSDEEV